MHAAIVFFFATATGITLAGIAANTYLLFGEQRQSTAGRVIEALVMIFAGPVMLIGKATASFRKKGCSSGAYLLAIGLGGFWSFVTGTFALALLLALRG